MSMRTHALRATGLWLSIAAAPIAAAAQETPAADELPPASGIVARYVEALGGREAVLRPATSRSTGRFAVPAAGLEGEMVILSARPNKLQSKITIPGMGEIRSGYDGEIGWSVDPMMGARILEGKELDALREQATPTAALRDAAHFQSMETVERAEIEGRSCYKVRLVWTSGRESFDCYSTETGLLVASIGTQESPMGSIEVTTTFSDYKDFSGVQMPTRMVQRMMGQQQVMILETVEHDVVDPAAFELPAEIGALLRSKS